MKCQSNLFNTQGLNFRNYWQLVLERQHRHTRGSTNIKLLVADFCSGRCSYSTIHGKGDDYTRLRGSASAACRIEVVLRGSFLPEILLELDEKIRRPDHSIIK